ncbi:hypothetical protein WMO13_07150 [Ignatzschineria larvae DSM 13226]|uniref:Uncharacterized protein n=1 Tax=Ignatzschineria larvae DSM 13226 TaxID=1111732 RepID=A0ABZ3BZG4_9GAMM
MATFYSLSKCCARNWIPPSICTLYGLKEIVILGYSMGAYGAIIYSSIMTFDIPQRILLFGPKVNLYSRRVKKVYEVLSNNKYKELYDIADCISELPDLKYKSFIFVYGEQDLLDAESIMFYQNLFQKKGNINYKIFSVLNSGHELFRSFKLVGLPKVLRLIFNGSFPDEIKQGSMHKKLVLSDLAKLRKLQGKDRINRGC